MADQIVRGLVIREMTVGENDKRITLFAKGRGKITAFAKGARKQKSPLLAGTQVLAYGDFTINQRGTYTMIKQIELVEFFHGIRQDVFSVAYAMYMMELLDYVIVEEQGQDQLLLLTLKTLKKLELNKIKVKLLINIFELKVMNLCGYSPEVLGCSICSKHEDIQYFSSSRGGVLCSSCNQLGKYGKRISEGTLNTIRYILLSQINQVFAFDVSDSVLLELNLITRDFLDYHLGKKFKTLDFITDLENF